MAEARRPHVPPGTPGAPWTDRVALAVAVTVYALVAVPGVLLARSGADALAGAVLLLVIYLLPARHLRSIADVRRRWRPLLARVVAGTLAWDAATALVLHRRPLLSEWYLVYTSGPLVFGLLFLLHGSLVQALARDAARTVWNPGRRE